MKAFKKWRETVNIHYECPDCGSMPEEMVWKAALEFIYDKLDYSEEHKEIKDFIENELED